MGTQNAEESHDGASGLKIQMTMELGATLPGLLIQSFWAAGLAYLLKRRSDHLNRELETKATERLDSFRSALHKEEEEHRVRFTRLHEQRARVIAGTYARIDRLHRAVRGMIQAISSDEQRPGGWDDAIAAYRELAEYWFPRSIWLLPETNDAIRPIVDMLLEPINHLAVTKDRNWDDLMRTVRDARQIVEERVPAARTTMEQHLRQMLTGTPLNK